MSQPERRRRGATGIVGALVLLAAWLTSLPNGTTYAAWSDFTTIPGHVGAGVWLTDGDPPLPEQCLGIVFDRIMIGTNKDDTIAGTPGNDLVFGLQGKDVLDGGGGQDCLVGGNGKDDLRGGEGDDVLVGGNAKDRVDGGDADGDLCDGGRGTNTLVGCESPTTASLFSTTEMTASENETQSVLVAPTEALVSDVSSPASLTETDSGASVEDPPGAPLVETTTSDSGELVVQQPDDAEPVQISSDEVQP